MVARSNKQNTPLHITKILSKLGKSDVQLGEFFLNKIYSDLDKNGYADASAWAPAVLPSILNEIGNSENTNDAEDFLLNLEGTEKSIAEAVYDNFTFLRKNVKNAKYKEIRDTLVYSLGKKLPEKHLKFIRAST